MPATATKPAFPARRPLKRGSGRSRSRPDGRPTARKSTVVTAKPPAAFVPRTALAAALWRVREQGIAAGEPLLTLDEVLEDLRRSRAE